MASRGFITLLCAILISLPVCQFTSKATKHPDPEKPYQAPLYAWDDPDKIPDVYMIIFGRDHTIDDHWDTIGRNFSSSPGFANWGYIFGYTAELNATSLDLVRQDRSVDFVEAVRIMRLHSLDSHWDADAQNDTWTLTEPLDILEPRADDDDMQCFTTPPQGWTTATQRVAPWHLNVISAGGRLPRPIRGPYDYMQGAGQGVNVYVLDTGINIAHDYFGGRAENFGGIPSDEPSPYIYPKEPMYDTRGHGTAVAGLIGADRIGVARAAKIISVKVSDSTGNIQLARTTTARYTSAFHDIIKAHIRNCDTIEDADMSFRGSIAVMSHSWDHYPDPSLALFHTLKWARMYGINMIAAAGNYDEPVGGLHGRWPCAQEDVICVGSIGMDYARHTESCYGPEVDFLAPGVGILTTSYAGGRKITRGTGTSLAAPIVAGVAAIFVSWKGLAGGPGKYDGPYTTAPLKQYLQANALRGICSNVPDGQPNLLVNTGIHSLAKDANEPFILASKTASQRWKCPVDGPFAIGGPNNPRPG